MFYLLVKINVATIVLLMFKISVTVLNIVLLFMTFVYRFLYGFLVG